MQKNIQKIFSEVPATYELLNHLLTLGLDIPWRKRVAGLAASYGGRLWIDVCSGTGETAVYLNSYAAGNATVFATDFSRPMLTKAVAKKKSDGIIFSLSDIRHLPIVDGSFDVITSSFATRNINTSSQDLLSSFQEYRRILKPGGLFINLETSQPSAKLFRFLVHGYVKLIVRSIGTAISGSRRGYSYLAHTIPRFYPADTLTQILRLAEFTEVSAQKLFGGVAAIHQAKK